MACARRTLLLRVHHNRLRPEDLEDCYSQAVTEVLAGVKAGRRFTDRVHLANALELRFLSRVRDRRRALGGRSPIQAALEHAEVLGLGDEGDGVEDHTADVSAQVILREELRCVRDAASQLSSDQRLVLGSQLRGESCAELCRAHGWSREKYRKVAQRARARLRVLVEGAEGDVPPGARASEEIAGQTYAHVSPHT